MCDTATGLWIVNIAKQSMSQNSALTATEPETLTENSEIASETIPERIQFLHAALGYPVLTTFLDAIENGHYTSIPELTASRARKYLKQSADTIEGHLEITRNNVRLTRAKKKCTTPIMFPGAAETPHDMHPLTPVVECSNAMFADRFPITGQLYSDLPGQFVCASTSGMKYQMVVYNYDSNNILVKPMKSRTAAEHTRAYKVLFNHLTSRGLRPKLQKLDNEASAMLK